MSARQSHRTPAQADEAQVAQSSAEGAAEQPVAWEQVEHGRYMPRRVRGSFRGRELG
jgi:hypothetical protein